MVGRDAFSERRIQESQVGGLPVTEVGASREELPSALEGDVGTGGHSGGVETLPFGSGGRSVHRQLSLVVFAENHTTFSQAGAVFGEVAAIHAEDNPHSREA